MIRSLLLLFFFCSTAFAQPGNHISIRLTKPERKIILPLIIAYDSAVIRATNEKGDHLAKLKPQDFLVVRGSDTAEIISCTEEHHTSTKDLALSFILDNSGSMYHSYDSVAVYMDSFIDSLADGFVGNVITFDNVERKPNFESGRNGIFLALSGFTSEREALKDFWHFYDTIRSEFTPLYDALVASMRQVQKRRLSGDSLRQDIIIVVTDGVDNASRSSLSTLREFASAMPLTLYTISYRIEPDNKLDWLARRTKGKHYTTDELFLLHNFLEEIRKNITASYTLKYQFTFKGAVGK
jgi:hypothetical protein